MIFQWIVTLQNIIQHPLCKFIVVLQNDISFIIEVHEWL
jgi:hypothetical protein